MIIGLGVDVFDVARMEAELRRAGSGFTRQIFSREEIEECRRHRRPAHEYAARFAAKEALVKALGAEDAQGLPWPDIHVLATAAGQHRVVLHGRVERVARRLGVTRALVSIARTRGTVVASVVLESRP